MIRKLVRQMLTAQILSALTVSLCLLIDSVMIGRFLGQGAMAAYGFANPILLVIGAIGSMLAAGIQVSCSKSLAHGDHEETNRGYSSSIAVVLAVSALFIALVVSLRNPIASALGAEEKDGVLGMTADYLAGFSIGAPGSMGALVLIPFLQMAGQSNLLIVAVAAMTVSDVVLDLLLLQMPNPMFGMGLASSLSYYVAMAIAAVYFFSKKCVFRFSWKRVSMRKIGELFKNGIPASFAMASNVLLIFGLNRILRGFSNDAVAALSVITTVGNASGCIITGIGGVSLTMSGVFYHEEDRTGLRDLVRQLTRSAVILGLAAGLVLVLVSPLAAHLFLPSEKANDGTREMVTLGLRLFAAGLIPASLCAIFKNAYQSTERVLLTETISVIEGLLLPMAVALAFSSFLRETGVWLYYAGGEWLALLAWGLYVRFRTGHLPWREDACLLLRKDFGVPDADLLEADIHSLDEVPEVARRAETFCLERGKSDMISKHIALCIEEMAVNTIEHGFRREGKPRVLSVRVLHKADRWVLRFRDNCRPHDPIHYVPGEDREALSIRLMLGVSTEARYTYSMNLNNLTLELPPQ